jgi:crotonobetainyl-CoA:carnitine CoA-transferase CaiB-like acyl-CoA transferase
MSRTPPHPLRAPPALGADTQDVLREWLGAEPDDLVKWRNDRVI